MLRIRQSQYEVFEQGFNDGLLETMRQIYPRICRSLGDRCARERVDRGIADAKAHGVLEQENHERYVHLLFSFDRDELDQPWAKTIIGWDTGEFRRLAALERRASIELARVADEAEQPVRTDRTGA